MDRIQAIKNIKATLPRQLRLAGLLFFGIALVSFWLYTPSTQAQQSVSVLNRVDVSFSGLRLNRATRTFDSLATLTNGSDVPILPPISLVIRNISPDTVTLANEDGITAGGELFIDVPVDGDGELSPGETVSNIVVKFNNPTRVKFTFEHEVLGFIEDDGVPEVSISSPNNGLITADESLDVSGNAGGGTSSVVVNGVNATLDNGAFTAQGIPLAEGTNLIVATAQNNVGDSASDSITVRRDTDPPLVVIETPRDGDRLVSEMVTIAGTVNDIIPGATVNEDDVTLMVNGLPAAVNNRTFILPDLPLALGSNTITATAVDRAGNTSSTSITINREQDLAGIQIVIAGGNNQRGSINSLLPVPLTVSMFTTEGEPIAGRPFEFEVSRGDGFIGDPNTRQITALTDAEGNAVVNFTLGSRTGEGFHRVLVTTPGSLTFAEFCATAEPAAATTISIAGTPPERGVAGQTLSEPVSVIVTDLGGNPVPNLPVAFQVDLGGGDFGGQQSTTATTNPDGIASVELTLGPNEGVANNQVSATFEGNPGFQAVFTVSGLLPGALEDTRVSGVVQDSAGNPIVGVRAIIRETVLEALTGTDGRFTIANVPPGGHRVGVLGSAANDPDNGIFFPDIDFAIEVVSGVDNELDQIVVLPFLDQDGGKLVGGNQDVILTMEGVQGFSVKVFANSVILPDGTRGEVFMSSSQVKFDKIPMPPPQGSTPLIVGTLQPAGIRFDPPAQVIYPNVEGLAPGDVADIFAFHHDIGQFVNIGPGTVSEDGSVVVSDPGFGIVQSGWHCLIRIPGPVAQCANGCSATASPTPPLVLAVGDSKMVTVNFSPSGTLEGSWSTANTAVSTVTGGSSLTATVAGVAGGMTTIISPTNRIPLPPEQGGDKTCAAEIEVTPVELDLDIDGVSDAMEETQGGLVVRNFDSNTPPRKQIIIQKAKPATWTGNVILKRSNAKVKVFSAATGGNEITFNGTDNKFANTSLPKNLYVEGKDFSSTMRDVELNVALDVSTDKSDIVRFTVLWVDQPSVAVSGTISADNDKKAGYKGWTVANTLDLGVQLYNANFGARMGWGSETSADVHPSNFSFAGSDLKLERDFNFNDWVGNGTSLIDTGTFSATIPPGNDTGPGAAMDNDPSPNGKIYDWDAAGLNIPVVAKDTIHRTRNHFKAFASITIDGTLVRCSPVRDYFIRFSMKQIDDPTGSNWQVIDPPDVVGDKQAGNGSTKLTWDLQ